MSDEARDIVGQFKKRLEKLEIQIEQIDRNVSEILRVVRKQEED
jgi:hypothetical protein